MSIQYYGIQRADRLRYISLADSAIDHEASPRSEEYLQAVTKLEEQIAAIDAELVELRTHPGAAEKIEAKESERAGLADQLAGTRPQLRYEETCEVSDLVLRDGEKPDVFTLAPVSQTRLKVLGRLHQDDDYEFLCSVLAEGWEDVEGLGGQVQYATVNGRRRVSREVIDWMPKDIVHELFLRVMQISQLQIDLKKKRTSSYEPSGSDSPASGQTAAGSAP